MAEFRSSSRTPLQAVLEPRIYIYLIHTAMFFILVHVLIVRTKQQHTYDTNIILLFQIYNCMIYYFKYIIT